MNVTQEEHRILMEKLGNFLVYVNPPLRTLLNTQVDPPYTAICAKTMREVHRDFMYHVRDIDLSKKNDIKAINHVIYQLFRLVTFDKFEVLPLLLRYTEMKIHTSMALRYELLWLRHQNQSTPAASVLPDGTIVLRSTPAIDAINHAGRNNTSDLNRRDMERRTHGIFPDGTLMAPPSQRIDVVNLELEGGRQVTSFQPPNEIEYEPVSSEDDPEFDPTRSLSSSSDPEDNGLGVHSLILNEGDEKQEQNGFASCSEIEDSLQTEATLERRQLCLRCNKLLPVGYGSLLWCPSCFREKHQDCKKPKLKRRRKGLNSISQVTVNDESRSGHTPSTSSFFGLSSKRPCSFPGSELQTKQARMDNSDILCIVCKTNQKNTTIVHGRSGHLVSCHKCAKKIFHGPRTARRCPYCQRSMDNYIFTYVV